MAIEVWEVPDSRGGTEEARTLKFQVRGTADDGDVIDAVDAEAPATHEGLPRRAREPITIDAINVDERNPEDCLWEASVHYQSVETQRTEPRETGDAITSFQIGGGTLHVTQAITHVRHFVPGQAIVEGGAAGAINVVDEGGRRRVEGVDVPQLNGAQLVNLTRYIAAASFTSGYRKTVSQLALHTNNAGFTIVGIDAYAECEVLFLGMDANWRAGDDDVEAQFQFAILKNVADVCSAWHNDFRPAAAAAVAKKGWEYLWIKYQDQELAVGGKTIITQVPAFVSIDQVLYAADLTALNP
ncbi:MAG TPA: hypothetical protein VMW52_02025 [Phycisphaerae bacterium]|nr:hypothetical protein [Phycisphaerae bacterium]